MQTLLCSTRLDLARLGLSLGLSTSKSRVQDSPHRGVFSYGREEFIRRLRGVVDRFFSRVENDVQNMWLGILWVREYCKELGIFKFTKLFNDVSSKPETRRNKSIRLQSSAPDSKFSLCNLKN